MNMQEDSNGGTSIINGDSEVELVESGFRFVEGPVWDAADQALIFSDIAGDTMYRWNERDGLSPYRKPSQMANGNVFDLEGRLVTCEHASSRLVRQELNGDLSVLASHYDSFELNSPNDVVVRGDGNIYFTDPDSGRKEFWGVPRPRELPYCGVYRWSTSGELDLLVDDFVVPNGLCFSLDETRLFVNDTALRHIRQFAVRADGLIEGGEVWAETGGQPPGGHPDGMKIDSVGNLYCTGPGGIVVFDQDGTLIATIEVPENVSNFNWGGDDLTTLYITASTSVYRVRTGVRGR